MKFGETAKFRSNFAYIFAHGLAKTGHVAHEKT